MLLNTKCALHDHPSVSVWVSMYQTIMSNLDWIEHTVSVCVNAQYRKTDRKSAIEWLSTPLYVAIAVAVGGTI